MDSVEKEAASGSPLVELFVEFKREFRKMDFKLSEFDEQVILIAVQMYLTRAYYRGYNAAFEAVPALRSPFYMKPGTGEQLFQTNEPNDEQNDG